MAGYLQLVGRELEFRPGLIHKLIFNHINFFLSSVSAGCQEIAPRIFIIRSPIRDEGLQRVSSKNKSDIGMSPQHPWKADISIYITA